MSSFAKVLWPLFAETVRVWSLVNLQLMDRKKVASVVYGVATILKISKKLSLRYNVLHQIWLQWVKNCYRWTGIIRVAVGPQLNAIVRANAFELMTLSYNNPSTMSLYPLKRSPIWTWPTSLIACRLVRLRFSECIGLALSVCWEAVAHFWDVPINTSGQQTSLICHNDVSGGWLPRLLSS